ncbi:MAG: 16S rRNA (guanine(527)-N(7))-methyltransferase RsmG [Rhodospirillales bacterium]|nr:16S rRNA (guanine(527)-N(7))-methyltransferase RsmG [Rhodospirillales bacterium]
MLSADAQLILRLEAYLALLRRWTQRINLVSAASLVDPWRRHILDSGQLACHLPPDACRIVDLGSGAGLPGIVVAVLTGHPVTLVESDARKCAFLREAVRASEIDADVVCARIEVPPSQRFDVVMARALAPLPRLLPLALPWLDDGGVCLFLKGARVADELTQAKKTWTMRPYLIPSRSDSTGVIIKIEDLARRDEP